MRGASGLPLWWALLVIGGVVCRSQKPHVVVIVADDMGWNDVGFHGSDEIPTPNIDALAYNGVILNSHYTQAMCTPSRSAFLTGKYPIHLGMQHILIMAPEPWGLPLNETLLPEYLRRNGYRTHAVGKWHLGFHESVYTPTHRGFDSHYGYWQGFQDYYSHQSHATFTSECGYDFRRNMTVDWEASGRYATELFTEEAVRLIDDHNPQEPMFLYLAHLAPHTGNPSDPLQAPDSEIAKFRHIQDPQRRVYAAMVSMLDKSVGTVIAALREKEMLENSIILFMSDNGGQTIGLHANHASNYPLRGMKLSHWEGGQRGVAAIWSPLIKKSQRVSNELMHITDWIPTIYSAIGLNKKELPKIDGIDMWETISEGKKSPRTELLYNFDDTDDVWNYAALREGDWKYMYGSPLNQDSWYGSSGRGRIYKYREDLVLNSDAATAIAGLQTFQQITEKKIYRPKGEENFTNYSVELLDSATIQKLRESSIIKCIVPNIEDIPEKDRCEPKKEPCLFNLRDDPCEMVNMYHKRPEIVAKIEQKLEELRKTALPIRNKPRDPKADPIFHNNTWVPWKDLDEVVKQKITLNNLTPLTTGLISAACLAFAIVITILLVISVKKKIRYRKHSSELQESESLDNSRSSTGKSKFFEDRELQLRHSFKDDIRTLE